MALELTLAKRSQDGKATERRGTWATDNVTPQNNATDGALASSI